MFIYQVLSVTGLGLLSKDDNSLVFLADQAGGKAGHRGQMKPLAKEMNI